MKQIYIFIILFTLFNSFTFSYYNYEHELTHAENFKIFGCDNINMEYSLTGGKATAVCTLTNEDLLGLNMAQSNVEAIGYQLKAFMVFCMFNILMFGLMMFWRRE